MPTSDILTKDTLSEGDVHLLMRRINASYGRGDFRKQSAIDRQISNLISSRDGGYPLTNEQVEKGRAWLNKHRKDMGYRETDVMDNFDTIRLIGTAPGEYNDYQYPYYEVLAKPDSEGHRARFQYKVEGGKLYILG